METISIKFREYKEFNYIGKANSKSFMDSSKSFPFLGYRAYSDEALPIIEEFTYEEFSFIQDIKSKTKRERISSYYKFKNYKYYLKNNVKRNKSLLKEIWDSFRSTRYIAAYYKSLQFLNPDYEKSTPIEGKYIYIFRTVKGSNFSTIYNEYLVKNNKYYQAIKSIARNEDGSVGYYYYDDTREYKSKGTSSISLPREENSRTYDYLFVLSKIKLPAYRIETILHEINKGTCQRAKQISLVRNSADFKLLRKKFISYIKSDVELIKKEFDNKFKQLYTRFPDLSDPVKSMFIPYINEYSSIPKSDYSDILYNDPNDKDVNHIVFLTDYIDCADNFKADFDHAITEYDGFLKKEENGFLKTDLKLLNDLTRNVVEINKDDTSEMIDFKKELQERLKKENNKFTYKTWSDKYTKELEYYKKEVEVAGINLASVIDTVEFCSIQYDYHFLKTKSNFSNSDELLIEDIIDKSGDYIFKLMGSDVGKLYLKKMSIRVDTNFGILEEYNQKSEDILTLYNTLYESNDWFTLIIIYPFRKICSGFNSVFGAYVSTLPKIKYNTVKKILAKQDIIIRKRNSKTLSNDQYKSAMTKADKFGNKLMAKSGGYKTIRKKNKTISVEISTYELHPQKVNSKKFKAQTGLNGLTLALELWNLRESIESLKKIEDYSIYSPEYISYAGAVFDVSAVAISLIYKNMPMIQTQWMNIYSSTFDYFSSGAAAEIAINNNDYDSAAYSGLAAISALGSMAGAMIVIGSCIKAGTMIGAAGGSLAAGAGAVPGAFLGLIIGAVCGILYACFTMLANKYKDNIYELWVNHCYWGNKYGSGKGYIPGVNAPFNKWNNPENGLSHQIVGFYSLFYNFSAELIYSQYIKGKVTNLGFKITPTLLEQNSIFSIDAKITRKKRSERGKVIASKLDLIYIPDIVFPFHQMLTPSGTNCDVIGDYTKDTNQEIIDINIKKIIVTWTDNEFFKKNSSRYIFYKGLTELIEKKDDESSFSDPYLIITINLDIKGDKKYIVSKEFKFELER